MDVIKREATQTSKVTQEKSAKPFESLYCIKHDQMVKVEYGTNCGMGHVASDIVDMGDRYQEAVLDFCCFEKGYALVPPPVEWLDEPPADLADEVAEEAARVDEWVGER